MATTTPIHFTGDPEADAFLGESPLALMIGFVLDQQVTVQKAFSSPLELSSGSAGSTRIESPTWTRHALEDVFREKPALHRFPANMARRTQEFCAAIASEYDGDAAAVWTEARDGADLERRLLALPGIGEMKARTLVGVIAKRLGVRPNGWEEFAPPHEQPRQTSTRPRRCSSTRRRSAPARPRCARSRPPDTCRSSSDADRRRSDAHGDRPRARRPSSGPHARASTSPSTTSASRPTQAPSFWRRFSPRTSGGSRSGSSTTSTTRADPRTAAAETIPRRSRRCPSRRARSPAFPT